VQIQILNITPSNPTGKNGKSYSKLEVAFKNLTFQGKVEGKQLMGFGATKPAHDALITAQPGEVYEIEIFKNDKGYNDWVNASKSIGAATAAGGSISPPTNSRPASTSATPSPKSTYETPEERAKKQIYIVRQSSLSNAIDLLSVGSKTRPDVKEVIAVASEFEAFVFGDKPADASFGDLDTMDDFPDMPQ
jgi:hypothetical protein